MASNPLRLTDTLPAGLHRDGAVATRHRLGCAGIGSGTVTCAANNPTAAAIYPIALGTLAAPTSVGTVTVTVSPRADNCASNSVTNTATLVSSTISETSVSDNTATAVTGYRCGVNLSVSKTNNTSTLASGQTTSYTVTVANGGPSEAGGSVLLDTPSAGLSSCTVTACTPSGGAPVPGRWPLAQRVYRPDPGRTAFGRWPDFQCPMHRDCNRPAMNVNHPGGWRPTRRRPPQDHQELRASRRAHHHRPGEGVCRPRPAIPVALHGGAAGCTRRVWPRRAADPGDRLWHGRGHGPHRRRAPGRQLPVLRGA